MLQDTTSKGFNLVILWSKDNHEYENVMRLGVAAINDPSVVAIFRKNRKLVDTSAAVCMQHQMQPRTTVLEKVNETTIRAHKRKYNMNMNMNK